MEKTIVLDFGGVIAGPTTGSWFITPEVFRSVESEAIPKLMEAATSYSEILSRPMKTEEEEFLMFMEYYQDLFHRAGVPISASLLKRLACNITYSSEKYTLYDGVKEELDRLASKYRLLLLTDNWPCITRILKEYALYDDFTKVYISSVYGSVKREGTLFEYPIRDFALPKGEAIFIDDNPSNLEIGEQYGFDCRLMDRHHQVKESKYKVLTNLKDM